MTPLLGKLEDHGIPLALGFAISAAPALFAAAIMISIRLKMRDCGTPELSQ